MVSRYALFFAVGGFSIGALLRSLFVFGGAPLGFMLFLSLLFASAYHFTKQKWYALLAIALVFSALGAGRVMLVPSALSSVFVPYLDRATTFVGVVASDPDVRESNQRVILLVREGDARERILVVLPAYPRVSYGETLAVSGVLKYPTPFETDTGRTFRYDRYLAKDRVFAMMPQARGESIGAPTGISAGIFGSLYRAKQGLIEGLENALPEPEAGLAAGILVGGKQGLGERLYDAFIIAGLVHIVVLSGYNVMIVATALMRALSAMPKRFALLIAALSICAFVIAAGAGSASVRAGAMAALALATRATGRTYDVLRALACVVLLMLVQNPLLLAYDVGFQFSIAATLGLILLTPILEQKILFVRNRFLRELSASSIAAQLGVLPILLYQTGNLSVYAIPANLLVLPVIPLAMLLSFIAALVGYLVPVFAPVFGLPAYLILSYVVFVAEHTAALPLSGVAIPAFSFIFVIIAYGILARLATLAPKRRKA